MQPFKLPFTTILILTLVFAGGSVAIGSILLGGSGSVQLQKGLVLHAKLDGTNYKDSSPYRNNGAALGNPSAATDRKGQIAKALAFDGDTDLVDFGSSSDFDFGTGSFTYSIWFKHGNEGSTNQHFFTYTDTSYNNPRIYFRFSPATTFQMVATDGTISAAYTVATTLADDNWHMATMVKNATDNNVYHYIDGALVETDDITGQATLTQTDANVVIGSGHATDASVEYTGDLDDARVYNRALSAAEVLELYDSYSPSIQVSTIQKGLVGYWKLDGNAKDSTPNVNIGTVTGATLTTDRKEQSNKAYLFDATGEHIGLGDVLDDVIAGADKKFSISTWVKPASTMTNNPIVGKLGDSNCTEDQRQFTLALRTSSKPRLTFYNGLTSSNLRAVLGSTAITDTSKWYNIVVTYDGSIDTNDGLDRVALYVDGVAESTSLESSSGSLGDIADGTAHIGIGQNLSSSGAQCFPNTFDGSIDDARIYNRSLSAAEILELYETYQ
jgi:hypothetical protein